MIVELNTDSPRTGIASHFHPANDTPIYEEELKKVYRKPIFGYEQFNKFPKIYVICPEEDKLDTEYYFCDICKHCNKISSTISNVIIHASKHDNELKKELIKEKDRKRTEKIDDELKFLSSKESKTIANYIHKFFLLNGIAFNKIESDELKSLTADLMNRKELSDYAGIISNRIEAKIFSDLRNASHISASFDGWTGIDTQHYLGVTIRCIINKSLKWFTIGFSHIEEIHATSVEIGYLLTKSFREFGIIGRVRSVVSDSHSVMTCAAVNIDVWGCECILHMLHTLLGSFVNAAKPLLTPIFNLASYLANSTKWTAFAKKRNICSIPSFTAIRWSSMYATFKAINSAKPYIIEFSASEKKDEQEKFQIDYSVVIDLIKPLKIFKNWLEGFESDDFGSQSDFLNGWYAINKSFQDLTDPRWNDAKNCMKEKKNELEKRHKETFEYLTICAILNPNTCLKRIPEKSKRNALNKIIKEMQMVPKKEENEDDQTDEPLTRDGFKALNLSDPLDQLYTRVWECSVNLFDYWISKLKGKTYSLADVALNYLSRLATSASTERLFSRSRRIQTFERVRLLPETLHNLVIIAGNYDIATQCFY